MSSARGGILVIGRQGQLAQSLAAAGRADVVCVGRPEADLTDTRRLTGLLQDVNPKIILNAAAYTSVDGAESEVDAPTAINRDGPAHLAWYCKSSGIPLIHISTDMVFDGSKAGPYAPADAACPIGAYGVSKWQGEEVVRQLWDRHLIVRVSWVFSEYAHNFVRTMLTLARTRGEVTVVNDQVGYPTYCPDLAAGLLKMADAALQPDFAGWGTYHLAGTEATDRASMAEAIFAESAAMGGPSARVKGVPTSEYETLAVRPLNAQLDPSKAMQTFGIDMPDWRMGLSRTVGHLVTELGIASKGAGDNAGSG